MTPATLVERLRGIVRVPVNDGAGLLDGKDFFERTFPTSNLAREAADEIERLRKALGDIVKEADSGNWTLPSSFANCARAALPPADLFLPHRNEGAGS